MPWPTHEDGSNKRIADMTAEERERVMADARERYRSQADSDDEPTTSRMDNWSLGDWQWAAQRRVL